MIEAPSFAAARLSAPVNSVSLDVDAKSLSKCSSVLAEGSKFSDPALAKTNINLSFVANGLIETSRSHFGDVSPNARDVVAIALYGVGRAPFGGGPWMKT